MYLLCSYILEYRTNYTEQSYDTPDLIVKNVGKSCQVNGVWGVLDIKPVVKAFNSFAKGHDFRTLKRYQKW